MDSFTAYHGVDAASHQRRFGVLSAQGWRLDALDVSGDPSAPSYAAVWVPSDGRAWAALHGLDATGYQQRFDELTGQVRYGDLAGTSAIAHSRGDDLDWALLLDHRIANEEKDALVRAVDAVLDGL